MTLMSGHPPGRSPASAPDIPPTVRTLESAVEALREQLVKANQWAEAERARASVPSYEPKQIAPGPTSCRLLSARSGAG